MSAAVASIGCTDPWNAAGLGLDIRALAACGIRPFTVVAGVTAQDAQGLTAAAAVTPELLAAQLASLRAAEIGAYRIGALLDRASVEIVARHLRASGVPAVYDPAGMQRAARALVAAGANAALVKGGHLHDCAIDVLAHQGDVEIFEAPRIAGSLRGTGCLLACGAAAALARGAALRDAIVAGRALVRDRFVHAETIAGMRVAY